MKVLVAYMSQTGNTKKVAQAMFDEIADMKEMKRIEEVESIVDYDLAFLGFPIHGEGPDKKTTGLIVRLCVEGTRVVLFVTHASPQDAEELPAMLRKFSEAAHQAEVVDMFDCQGQLAKALRMFMLVMPNAKYRRWARNDNSQGQPDEAQLNRARAFTRDVMKRVGAPRALATAA